MNTPTPHPDHPISGKSLDAEKALLSSMVLDNEIIGDVVERVRREDFYVADHQIIYQALVDLWTKDSKIDAVILREELAKRQLLEEIGGVPYIAELLGSVPSASHWKAYAKTVADNSLLRRVIAAGDKACISAREPHQEAKAVFDAAQQRFFEIGEKNEPTGIGGQPLSEVVVTPSGLRSIGEIEVGTQVTAPDGSPTRVSEVIDLGERSIWQVRLSDGGSARACHQQLWLTTSRADRVGRRLAIARTTTQIRKTLRCRSGLHPRWRYHMPYTAPIELTETRQLPISPYLLGVCLGDGTTRSSCLMLHNPECDVVARAAAQLPRADVHVAADRIGLAFRIKRLRFSGAPSDTLQALQDLGLRGAGSGEKFVPSQYLLADTDTRIQLLRGLIDTDGHVASGAQIEYMTISPRLAADVVWLVRSLGGRCSVRSKLPHYTLPNGTRRQGALAYRITISFRNGIIPVSSKKHLARYSPIRRITGRTVVGVKPLGYERCRTLVVENADHMYVAGDFLIMFDGTVR